MIDKEKIKTLLEELGIEGDAIFLAEQIRKFPGENEEENEERRKLFEDIKKKYPLVDSYQSWYSRALPFVNQVAPERSEEFAQLYKFGNRKQLSVTTFGISDYLHNIGTSSYGDIEDYYGSFCSHFKTQIGIIKALSSRLDSVLADIAGVIQAELFDNEIEASEELLKKKHIRASGVLAGVVLEAHLKKVCGFHGKKMKKKATLSDFNDALKPDVYDVAVWRQIQHLGDLRNLCAHKKDRDPEKEDVQKLIDGTKEIIKTVS